MNSMKWLRSALITNATFSTASGMLLLSHPALVELWLGVSVAGVLPVIGIGLLLFAADLLHQATRPRLATWRALYASAADLLWVVGTAVLLIVFADRFSALGVQLLAGVAAIVLFFGVWQFWAIGKVHQRAADRAYRHCVLVDTELPAAAMWAVIGDLGQIGRYALSLRRSHLEGGRAPGVGVVRTCEDLAGKRWSEQCTEFVPGRRYVVRFMTEAEDFPFPVSTMRGGWEVTPTVRGSRVMVWWEFVPQPRWLGRVIAPALAFPADRSIPKVVAVMAQHARIEHKFATAPQPTAPRLVPQLC